MSAYPTSLEITGVEPRLLDSIPGIWWVEPKLKTESRSNVAAELCLGRVMVLIMNQILSMGMELL